MKAVVKTRAGEPEVLQLREVEDPIIGDDEVLIQVVATAVNRNDISERTNLDPLPEGISPYLGHECSGFIRAVGSAVHRWKPGDQVCALLNGGGYAEKVAVPAGQVLPIPDVVSLRVAAGLPQAACTVWSTVFMMDPLLKGKSFLIHGGSSGIGTFAIQIAKHLGAKVFVTAGTELKLAVCKSLGADVCINYKTQDFVAEVKKKTGGEGVDFILDIVGGPYLQRNVDSLSLFGKLFLIGLEGGVETEINLAPLLVNCLRVQAALLMSRSPANKAEIVREVEKHVWPAIAAGKVSPVIYKSLPLSKAAEGHKLMESSTHIGKILLLP